MSSADAAGGTVTHPTTERWQQLAVAVCLAIAATAFTALIVRHSLAAGRLTALPVYDDVVYLLDGLVRLDRLETDGWRGLAADLAASPPHAPFSTLLALVCYALGGRHAWVPYAGNGLVVGLAFVITWRLARGLPASLRAAAVGLAACVPATAWSVHEFRPDLACGVITAGLLCEIVLLPARLRSPRAAVTLGLWLAAALWVKPTVFPVTLLLSAAAIGVALLRDRDWRTPRRTLAFVGTLMAVAAVAFLPYVVVAGRELAGYVWTNIFGSQRRFWTLDGTWLEHAGYYLTGPGGSFGVGRVRYLLLAWVVAALVVCRGRDRRIVASLGTVLACSYLLPTLNQVKTPFFGAVFYELLLFTAVVSMGRLWRGRAGHAGSRWLVAALVLLSVGIGVGRFRYPTMAFGPHGDAAAVQHAVADFVRSVAADGCRIAVPNSGWVNSTALAYSLTSEGIRNVSIREEWMSADLDQHRRTFDWADVIVTSEPGTGLVDEHHPAGPLQPALLELAGRPTGHVEIGRVPTAAGPAFHVFARPAAADPMPSAEERTVP